MTSIDGQHGCEKTHNAWVRDRLPGGAARADAYGWASVQLDGGIDAACRKVPRKRASEREDGKRGVSRSNIRLF